MDTYFFRKIIHRLPGRIIHAVPIPQPSLTTGFASRSQIGEICRQKGYRHVLVVTDRTISRLGYNQAICASLETAGIAYSVFDDIHSEPTISIISEGRKRAMHNHAEAIIALGGGSVMDSCKMIAASVKMPYMSVKALLLKFLPIPGGSLPLIMVPSTAGTGAEITVGAVVSNNHGEKRSTVLIGLNIAHVVHDSELTIHAPKEVTAACGIDALSHCIEGVVADVHENEKDMRMSMEGVKLILENLPIVLKEPENDTARLNMCRAAMYGGNAINTQLAGYIHAFAHSIGAKYHLSHGQAISLMLMPVLEYQQKACNDRYNALAAFCEVPDFLQAVRNLLMTSGMDKIASPVRACDHKELITMIAADSINYSAPITLRNKDIKQILEALTTNE